MEETVFVMFPFMAQGHIIPFLRLALQLEHRTNAQIIFVNTPLNITNLSSSLPENSRIRLTSLPFSPTDHGLPPYSENTDTLPYPLISLLFHASTSLKPSFHQLISNIITHQQQQLPVDQHHRPRVCIIADMFLGWTVDVANEFNLFHSIYFTSGAYGSAVYFSLWAHLPHCETDSDEFSLPDLPEVGSIHRSQLAANLQNANGTDSWSLILRKLLPFWFKTHGFLINTVEQELMSQTGFLYLRRKTNGLVPIWPVLPSLMHSSRRPTKVTPADTNRCITWLDARPSGSVLFVSFGSQNTISCSQMMALAAGLEASGTSFIWVVRPPIGFDLNGEFRSDQWLPEGFVERVIEKQNRGVLVHKWAPQLEILSHRSTRAFLSHCGWNSTVESLSHGVPIIGWPLSGEQFFNSKLLEEELGVCVEVARGSSCEVKCEEIARAIETVMGVGNHEKGEEMRKKACQIKKVIEEAIKDEEGFKGSCVKAMDDFINAAVKWKNWENNQFNGDKV